MKHEFIDAALSVVVLCAGGFIWLGKLLIRRHLAKWDAIEAKLEKLDEWYTAQQAIVRHPVKLNGATTEGHDEDIDSDTDILDPDSRKLHRRVRSRRPPSE